MLPSAIPGRERSADEVEVAAPGGFEAGASGIELVAKHDEAVLGEVRRLEVEAGGDELEGASAWMLASRAEAAQVCVCDAASFGVVGLCERG